MEKDNDVLVVAFSDCKKMYSDMLLSRMDPHNAVSDETTAFTKQQLDFVAAVEKALGGKGKNYIANTEVLVRYQLLTGHRNLCEAGDPVNNAFIKVFKEELENG